MAAQYYKINYKSDFVLTINSDAGWAVPFCIKFWTGMPSQAYFAGFDGENYVNCRVGETPTQLLVMFDDHHMPIGELKMQIAYHTTIEDFPDRQFNEVTNPTNVTVDIDGTEYQVMLDFTGESGAEIDFSMPSSGVMSVNGKIGYVTLNAEDVGAQPTIEDLAAIRSGAAAGATAVQPAALQEGLAGKQDTISDLSTIRSGASAGATAVQPAALESGLAEKQDTISDLATIRSGAAAGATAVQPAAMNTALAAKEDKSNKVTSFSSPTDTQYPSAKLVSDQLATKQGTISDLSTIRSGAAAGATAVQPAAFQEGLAGKQDTISDLSTIRSGAAAGATAVQPSGLTPIQTALQTIETVIPSAATAQNQLADKNFVNSSISTNTANFVGTYNSLAELQAVQNPTNNDYGFVIEIDAQGNEYYDRYKYVASSQQWLFEYKVESTPFTAAQWAAIQSGITSALVTKLNALPTNAELQQTLDGKADAADIPTALSQLSQDSTHRTVTDAEKSTWNGKQNALTFDNVPTANSNNPVKSGGVYQAIQDIDVSSQISGKEDKSNKVTSFSSPTDTQYPSAKLVSDQLATKQDVINDLADIRANAGKGATAIQSVTVGTTTTGAAGSSASVTNTGTATEPVLSFTIPQGAQGIQGIQGPQGERGPQGNTGVQVDSVASIIHSIDPTATYAAADVAGADAVQDVLAELTELEGEVTYGAPDQPLDLSSLTPQSAIIKANDNKWIVGYHSYKSVFLPITPTHQYKIKANANYSCAFAMLVSNEYTNNTAAVYANGGARTVISSGEEVIVTAGSNANYLWIQTNGESANTNMSPEYVAEYFGGVSTVKDKIENIEEEIVDRTTIGDTPNEPIDLEQYTPSGIFVGSDGKWKINYSSYKGIIIPITAGTTYKIVAGDSGAYYALLPSNTYANEQAVTFCTGTGKSSVSANTSKIFIAPSDANYMWIYISYSNTIYTPKELMVYNGQEQINEYLDERRGFFTKTKVIVAASNSVNPTEADYICTGTNDGAVIKQAISYAITNKIGTVHLKQGNYYLDTLDSNNAFLTIDLQDTSVTIEGGGYFRQAELDVTYDAYAALDDTTTYKVIYVKTSSRWAGSLILQDMDVKTPWNQKKIVGIDMVTYEGHIIMQSVGVYGYNSLYAGQVGHAVSVSNPPDAAVEGSIGIRTICRTPAGCSGNTFRNCGAQGWYEGWAINGEHLLCVQCYAIFNVYGYTFDHYANGAEQHPNVLLKCADERGVNGPRFYNNSKTQGILLIGFSFERKPDLAPGGQLGLAATEETPGQHRGIITYTIGYGTGSSSSNSTTQPFWEDGHGHGMTTRNLSQLPACTTSVRNGYKPNYLQHIWDTTLNKEVICIDEANKTWVDALGNIV